MGVDVPSVEARRMDHKKARCHAKQWMLADSLTLEGLLFMDKPSTSTHRGGEWAVAKKKTFSRECATLFMRSLWCANTLCVSGTVSFG